MWPMWEPHRILYRMDIIRRKIMVSFVRRKHYTKQKCYTWIQIQSQYRKFCFPHFYFPLFHLFLSPNVVAIAVAAIVAIKLKSETGRDNKKIKVDVYKCRKPFYQHENLQHSLRTKKKKNCHKNVLSTLFNQRTLIACAYGKLTAN